MVFIYEMLTYYREYRSALPNNLTALGSKLCHCYKWKFDIGDEKFTSVGEIFALDGEVFISVCWNVQHLMVKCSSVCWNVHDGQGGCVWCIATRSI
jgi:hypothetical protein